MALRRIVDVHAGERRALGCAFACCFCLLSSHYVLRPLRDAMAIAGDTKDLSRLFLLTLAATLLFTPVVTALVSRFPRTRFVPIVYRLFALALVVFYALFHGGSVHPLGATIFFVWTSVASLFALSLFWGLMADVFRREQGLRLFGLVGGGGTLGAVTGSFATATLVPHIGIAGLVLVSAVLLELAVRCVHALVASVGDLRNRSSSTNALPEGGILGWLRGLPRNRYLLAIIAYLLLFTFTSTCVYFEQARIVKAAVATHDARTALFAKLDLVVNVLSLVLQALVVGPLLRRLGVGLTLALLPALTLVGFVALGAFPSLVVVCVFQVLRRATDYGIAKPSREVLFTVVSREDKYKAKSFIDTFVYRGGDAFGAVTIDSIGRALGGGLLALSVPVCLAWAAVALFLGRASASVLARRQRSGNVR